MTYDELVTETQNYCENTFSTEDMDTFIRQAETRIYSMVQFPALRKNVTGPLTLGNQYLRCPSDFLSTHSIAMIDGTGTYSYLLNKDVNYIREAYPSPTATGLPKYYALFGPQCDDETGLVFILGPTPDAAYTAELHYFYYPQSIVDTTSGTTWLSDNFSPVLLYGTLVEAYTMMKGEATLLQAYNDKFKEACLMAKRLGDGLEKQDSYRSGQAKSPVV